MTILFVYYKLRNNFFTILNNNFQIFNYYFNSKETLEFNNSTSAITSLYNDYLFKLKKTNNNISHNYNLEKINDLINIAYQEDNILSLFDLEDVSNIILIFTTLNINLFDMSSVKVIKNKDISENPINPEYFKNKNETLIICDQTYVYSDTIAYYDLNENKDNLNQPVLIEFKENKFYLVDGYNRIAYYKQKGESIDISVILIDLNNSLPLSKRTKKLKTYPKSIK